MVSTEKQIKTKAGYVQVESFADSSAGYFCGSCRALDYDPSYEASLDGKDGYCTGLNVPVRTYGCCNSWKLGSHGKILGANGDRLIFRILR